jgi:hypothetical protein
MVFRPARRNVLSRRWLLAVPLAIHPWGSVLEAAPLPDLPTQIQAELLYITHSSWTEENPNSFGWRWFEPSDDIHGAINDIRVPINAPPNHHAWVEPAIGATAAIGMMQGVAYLQRSGIDVSIWDAVLDKFFWVWTLAHRQGQNLDPSSPDFGAFMNRLDYDSRGNHVTASPVWKTDVTALMMTASWKYWEYCVATGELEQAAEWQTQAWPIQKNGADYLVRMHDTTPARAIHLLPGNSTPPHSDAWIHFAGYAVPALRAASVWAQRVGAPHADYDRVASELASGLQSMKDPSRNIYFRYVPWQNGSYGAPTHGASIDQLTFVPVEIGAVPVDAFAAGISDWFTEGDAELSMTHPTQDPSDWRYFGTHWNWFFAGAPENDRLYPGPGFQLAKLEWKVGTALGAPVYTTRSLRRLDWGRKLEYSALWWFLTGEEESTTPNGFVDWRDSTNYSKRGENWARFVDTSAYFIEVLLMHEAGIDTDYNPLAPGCASDADGDGLCDDGDNCLDAANPSQIDSNRDGFGNACDADYDDDGVVGTPDQLVFAGAFGAREGEAAFRAEADANDDAVIGIPDFLLLGAHFGGPPGPSGLSCAGTVPCPTAASGSTSPAS